MGGSFFLWYQTVRNTIILDVMSRTILITNIIASFIIPIQMFSMIHITLISGQVIITTKHCQRHDGPRHCFYNLIYLSSFKTAKFSKLNTPYWFQFWPLGGTTIISSKFTHQMAPPSGDQICIYFKL